MLDQHKARAGELSYGWWTDTFANAIASIGRTVLVLQPWAKPVPLGRSWCLWELFNTLTGGGRLEIALAPNEESNLKQAMVRATAFIAFSLEAYMSMSLHGRCQVTDMGMVVAAMSAIDTRTAKTSVAIDQRMIQEVVRASAGGFGAVNRLIHARMREWLMQQAADRVDAAASACARAESYAQAAVVELRSARLVHATLLREQCNIKDLLAGEALCRLAIGEAPNDEAGEDLLTMYCMHELGLQLHAQGRYREATVHLRQAMHGRFKALKKNRRHPDTLASMSALGVALHMSGDHESAISVLRQALRHMREEADDADEQPATLQTLTALARVLLANKQVSEAEQLISKVVSTCRSMPDGATHPITLDALDVLVSVLIKLGDVLEGQKVLRELRLARLEQLGAEHPVCAATDLHEVDALKLQGHKADAAKLCLDCLARFSDALGAAHPQTCICAVRAAVLLTSIGEQKADPEELCLAAELLRDSLSSLCTTLGASDASTLKAIKAQDVLARVLLMRESQNDVALTLLRSMMDGAASALGHRHMHTSQLKLHLAAAWILDARQRSGSVITPSSSSRVKELMRDVLDHYCDELGVDHPKTQQVADELYEWLGFVTLCGPLLLWFALRRRRQRERGATAASPVA